MFMYSPYSEENPKQRKDQRELVLSPIGGKAKDVTGMIDPRLFKGDNKLYAIMNPQNCLWGFKYERGDIPEALKQRYTSFSAALKAAKAYYAKRNIEIVEVID